MTDVAVTVADIDATAVLAVLDVATTQQAVDVSASAASVDVAVTTATVEVAESGRQGPVGPVGPSGGSVVVTAAVDVQAMTVVTFDASVGIAPASSADPDDGYAVLGVTTTAALAGEPVTVVVGGPLPVTTTFPVGTLYLGVDGGLTSNHDSGVFLLNVAYAYTPTNVRVRIGTPFYR